jgi:hypothetical protein
MRDEDCYSCEDGQRLLGHCGERRDVLNEAALLQHGALRVLRKPEGGVILLKIRHGLAVVCLAPQMNVRIEPASLLARVRQAAARWPSRKALTSSAQGPLELCKRYNTTDAHKLADIFGHIL